MDRVDPDLSPEEQGFIAHYLGYADAFLRSNEYIVPEPLEETVDQNEREEVTERPCLVKRNPTRKAA